MSDLKQEHCKPCEGGVDPLDRTAAQNLLSQARGWTLNDPATEISRTYSFKNFYETMAFVNALAWVAHKEDHHPDLEVGYKRCRVRYTTHAIKGLSMNDFICAAKVNDLIGE
ncbi:pterin-4-alpha-carbinolamine dehydratase [Sulfurifustis variabilis]|uniref:Putative pterin-4-alpha-carbinolamine dehydratase n=1 Tax=Sulfurifustis variabilis TaxID=1675686 RepID=A0A1B4V9J7_9GAMM|nr:4a-hydroxytetrahydrobiopterin dehydratase [Sulfurifustis variabilis]BAU48164.1 pterin-4-alpha-carbinolamine dehydratase [Sulfurifustis variabilis]